jgi:CheY-like chemotaxis protein
MPGIGGFGVLTEIRQSSPNAQTPVILVTQVAEKDTLERCLAAGANAYHIKPVQRDKLMASVRDQLDARARTRTTAR